MVDEKALKSVLNILLKLLDVWNNTRFMIFINSRHKIDQADIKKSDKKIENNNYKPLHRYTREDVGCMKMYYNIP